METLVDKEYEMTTGVSEFPEEFFKPSEEIRQGQTLVRPSMSYWQDALLRFSRNKQSIFSFGLVIVLTVFAFLGPLIWNRDPAQQDMGSPSLTPNLGNTAVVVGEAEEEVPARAEGVNESLLTFLDATSLGKVSGFEAQGVPTTQKVDLKWNYLPGASGYVLYRNEFAPSEDVLGVPIGEVSDPLQVSFRDLQSLEARHYFYTIVARDSLGVESKQQKTLQVQVVGAISVEKASTLGLGANVGQTVNLPASPLGTDSLGRDLLARLMAGGRVSLFIGLFSSILSILFGIAIGSTAGFLGGSIDTILMRTTDLVTGLPFLLFMILLKVILNVGPGESGITALLISLVILSWTGTARLVRGQILQLRHSEFVEAARLMGAGPFYLIVRHMLPNLMGVILVTLTFQIPSAIFTEAFLSFVGLGVAAPATSWGMMCSDGIQSLLTHPYEFFAPAVVISLTVLAFNLLGDGLRDALDPKLRSNE